MDRLFNGTQKTLSVRVPQLKWEYSQTVELCRICHSHFCVYIYVENRGPVEAAVKTGPV